jgi:hypothetical protein
MDSAHAVTAVAVNGNDGARKVSGSQVVARYVLRRGVNLAVDRTRTTAVLACRLRLLKRDGLYGAFREPSEGCCKSRING